MSKQQGTGTSQDKLAGDARLDDKDLGEINGGTRDGVDGNASGTDDKTSEETLSFPKEIRDSANQKWKDVEIKGVKNPL